MCGFDLGCHLNRCKSARRRVRSESRRTRITGFGAAGFGRCVSLQESARCRWHSGSPWYRPPRNLIEQSGTEIVLFSARLGVREIFVLDAIGQILGDAVGG